MSDSSVGVDVVPTARLGSVLVVDDEVDILPEYQDLLEMAGFAVAVESDPEAALATVVAHPEIRLVITDLRMAKLDGAGLINRLRAALPGNRHVSFILVTGDATSQTTVYDLQVPILFKPVDFDALVSAVSAALAAQ